MGVRSGFLDHRAHTQRLQRIRNWDFEGLTHLLRATPVRRSPNFYVPGPEDLELEGAERVCGLRACGHGNLLRRQLFWLARHRVWRALSLLMNILSCLAVALIELDVPRESSRARFILLFELVIGVWLATELLVQAGALSFLPAEVGSRFHEP